MCNICIKYIHGFGVLLTEKLAFLYAWKVEGKKANFSLDKEICKISLKTCIWLHLETN